MVLNINSSVIPPHGDKEVMACNGHLNRTRYHPLFLFNQSGDLERSALQLGNV